MPDPLEEGAQIAKDFAARKAAAKQKMMALINGRVDEMEQAMAESRAIPLRQQNDQRQQNSALSQEAALKYLQNRQSLANRNMAGAGDATVRTLPPERMAALMGNGAGQSFANVSQPDPYADTPADLTRKAALSKLKLSSASKDGHAGTGEVSGGDSYMRSRMQELLSGKNQTARKEQGDAAREKQTAFRNAVGAFKNAHPNSTPAEVEAYGGGQGSVRGNRLKAREASQAEMLKQRMAQMAPYIAMMQAQHGAHPEHAAAARLHNAQAAMYENAAREQAGGGVPGAPTPGAAAVPGAPTPRVGITQRPMSAWERWLQFAQGGGNPDPYSAMPIPGQ